MVRSKFEYKATDKKHIIGQFILKNKNNNKQKLFTYKNCRKIPLKQIIFTYNKSTTYYIPKLK